MQNGETKLLWPIDKLHEWDKNPRTITKEAFERLKWQIGHLKEYKPLLVNQDGIVLGGNMRLKAYREMGKKDVWVSVVETKSDEEMWEYALSDNDHVGATDEDMLANMMPQLDIDWSKYAVDLKEPTNLGDLLDSFKEVVEDEVPEVSNEPAVSKLGEVYQLGRHRLMCGDSTKIEDVEKLMNGQKADMVFTDPPYGVNYEGKTKDKLTIENDADNDKENMREFWIECFCNMRETMKDGASYYCFSSQGGEMMMMMIALTESGFYIKQQIIWRKNTIVLGHSDYQFQHEPIIYGWKRESTHKFYGDRTQSSVWDFDKPNASKEHPTMKPIGIMVKAIKNSSKEGDIVMDLFGGSGSTLIACEQSNRSCFINELDPKYCDVIRKRYSKFIGKEDSWIQETPLINS